MKTTIKYLILLFGITANAQLEQETTNYSYDSLNRLVQVVFNDGTEKNYVYDDLGNRIQLNITSLSLDKEVLKNTITVYPNPTDSFLNIKLHNEFTSQETEIKLYDINGRLITNNKPTITGNNIVINVKNLSNGMYLVRLKSSKKIWSQLFIKK